MHMTCVLEVLKPSLYEEASSTTVHNSVQNESVFFRLFFICVRIWSNGFINCQVLFLADLKFLLLEVTEKSYT